MDFTKTTIPLALMASESIAHEAAIDSEPIRGQGIIVKYAFVCTVYGGIVHNTQEVSSVLIFLLFIFDWDQTVSVTFP